MSRAAPGGCRGLPVIRRGGKDLKQTEDEDLAQQIEEASRAADFLEYDEGLGRFDRTINTIAEIAGVLIFRHDRRSRLPERARQVCARLHLRVG